MVTLTSSTLTARCRESQDLMTTCINTGASHHMLPYKEELDDFVSITPEPITVVDGETFMATKCQNLRVEIPNNKIETSPIILQDVFYALGMEFTLLLVLHMDKNSCTILSSGGQATIQNCNDGQIGYMPLNSSLYTFTSLCRVPLQANVATSKAVVLTLAQLHWWLGHVGT